MTAMMCQSCGDAVGYDESDGTWVGSDGEVTCPLPPNGAHGPIVVDDATDEASR